VDALLRTMYGALVTTDVPLLRALLADQLLVSQAVAQESCSSRLADVCRRDHRCCAGTGV
jgi:hypothetical protein